MLMVLVIMIFNKITKKHITLLTIIHMNLKIIALQLIIVYLDQEHTTIINILIKLKIKNFVKLVETNKNLKII